jgi:hypothetical protein
MESEVQDRVHIHGWMYVRLNVGKKEREKCTEMPGHMPLTYSVLFVRFQLLYVLPTIRSTYILIETERL